MFIKRAAADARLTDKNNLLRRPPIKDTCETSDEEEAAAALALHGPPYVAPVSSIAPSIAPSITQPEPLIKEELPILKELDGLLNPQARTLVHPYKYKRDAQVAIGETALILGPQAASGVFGLGPGGAQAEVYSEGRQSWGSGGQPGKIIPEVYQRLQKSKQDIAEKAARRLESTLDAITPEKLTAVHKVDVLARVGKDMAIILDKVSPKEGPNEGGVHFHIFRPEFKQENHYETVNLGSSVPDSGSDRSGSNSGSDRK